MKATINFTLSILLAFCFFAPSCHFAGSESPINKTVENKGVAIDYTDTGAGDTTLLFIHGWCINKTYWSDQVSFFKNRYRIVTMDLPGFGRSGKNRNDWTTAAYGRDVMSIMDQLDLKKVILIGHSMAGDIILEATNDDPERVIGLVGVDNFKGFGLPEDSASKANYAEAILALKKNFKQVATDYFNQELFYKTTDSAVRNRILNDVYHSDSVIAVATMERSNFDEIKALAATKKKLYLINSDVTPTDSTGFKANNIPYEVLYIHATGHYPMIEKPEAFNTLLNQAIDKIRKDQ